MVSNHIDCPACGQAASSVTRVGPVTFVIQPCGHQIDEMIYEEMVAESSS